MRPRRRERIEGLKDSRRRHGYFPHRESGLHTNPFRVLLPGELTQVAGLPAGIEDFWSRGDHQQILGEAGRGKSTLLLALASRAEASGKTAAYEYIPEGARTYRTGIPGLDAFFLDEADRIGPLAWRRLLRAAGRNTCRIIIGCHRDQSLRFSRRGLALKTVHLGGVLDERFLCRILERRLGFAALPGGDPPRFSSDSASWLLERFGSDLRSLERFLYLFFQEPCGRVIAARCLAAFAEAQKGPATSSRPSGASTKGAVSFETRPDGNKISPSTCQTMRRSFPS